MKTLELSQIEINLSDGSVRLVFWRVNDGVRHAVPHLVGLMDYHDLGVVLEAVKQHLASSGYPWVDEDVLSRALKLREFVLSDSVVKAQNAENKIERDRIEAEYETQRQENEKKNG